MRVVIDPGHGGSDPGAVGLEPYRLEEKRVTLAVAKLLVAAVAERGWAPLLTRHRDRTLSLASRAAFANRMRAQLFVSVHANAAASAAAEGMEVYHFPDSAKGRTIAFHVLDRMLLRFPGHRNRGVKEANFAVLRLTRMPAILVECEFLTHPRQLEFLAARENQAGLAEAIAEGLAAAVDTAYQHTLPRVVLD
jgi:N-acetylmuramoyl-L-alanine amidase